MEIYNNYIFAITKALKKLNLKKIYEIEKIIFKKIKNGNKIFICGNGGSASVASHFLCDFNKGIKLSSSKKLLPKIISLNDNISLITAISNDIGYSKIFTYQFENYFNKDDLLITLSCSGSSKNIIDILNFAKKNNVFTIALTGFVNRRNKKKSDININFKIQNFGICEDMFQIIMHMISQNIRKKFLKNKKEIL